MELDLITVDEQTTIECPHCGASNEISMDPSSRRKRFIEECQVCSRDIDIRVDYDAGEPMFHALAA